MVAERIFAEPGTLTGSIGVVGGKIALRGLFDKIGVKSETVSRGKTACAMSMTDPFSLEEREGWKRLMLATALASRPKLLLLDEPVGGLTRTEREGMIELVQKTNRSGVSVLMIEHVMKAVQALAGRMLVLHHGEKIAEGPPSVVLRDEKVVQVSAIREADQK